MKKLLLFGALLYGMVTMAQTSQKRDPVNQIDYEMKLVQPGSYIMISTYKSKTEQDKSLVLKTSTLNNLNPKGVRIRLSNGENLIFDKTPLEFTGYAPERPNLTAKILITSELEQKLAGQEIVEFSLGQIKTPVKYQEPYENLQSLLKMVKDDRGF